MYIHKYTQYTQSDTHTHTHKNIYVHTHTHTYMHTHTQTLTTLLSVPLLTGLTAQFRLSGG